jgi:hypothetical protein
MEELCYSKLMLNQGMNNSTVYNSYTTHDRDSLYSNLNIQYTTHCIENLSIILN